MTTLLYAKRFVADQSQNNENYSILSMAGFDDQLPTTDAGSNRVLQQLVCSVEGSIEPNNPSNYNNNNGGAANLALQQAPQMMQPQQTQYPFETYSSYEPDVDVWSQAASPYQQPMLEYDGYENRPPRNVSPVIDGECLKQNSQIFFVVVTISHGL